MSQNEMPELKAENGYTGSVSDMRFVLRRRETARSADSGETGATTLPSLSRQRSTDRSWNPSRTSTFTYSRGSPLDPELLSSSPDFHQTGRSTLPRTSSHRNSGPGPTHLSSDFGRDFPALDTPDTDFVPFLAWRMTWTDGNRSRAEIDRTLFQLLSSLDAGLESDRAGKWYRTAFECTQAQLLERFQCLLKTMPSLFGQSEAAHAVRGSTADSIADDPLATSVTATADSESLRLAQRSAENHDAKETCGSFPPRESTLFGSTDVDTADGLLNGDDGSFHCVKPDPATGAEPYDASSITRNSYSKTLDEFLLRRVLDVSRDVFGAFVPRDGSFVTHTMCKRFWGSVDTILRVRLFFAMVMTLRHRVSC
ncbi:hypothetical protein LX32DRAFT_3311 [Colletotrichum zoysiae]|uniref:Uncharacterized protein n=1 Tax=Colletotrichum zoysiae TaxID=1216348 RepID=A0AAD9HUP2_9PEZI|nr:hypothetical protein LX32DRAFT_3311 [Colletotrichum zoysiae]